jgi:hypothetical protein
MYSLDYEYNDFRPTGFVSVKLPDDLVKKLRYWCEELYEPVNDRLVGNIEKELSFRIRENDDIRELLWEQLMLSTKVYEDRYYYPKNYKFLDKDCSLCFGNVWANFMKKHEFNPVHDHTGIWSFVIWIKIPYDINEELAKSPGLNANQNLASTFQFVFNDMYGNVAQSLHIKKEHEGNMILFPSNLMHVVNPFFTSDEERISIAGNIVYKTT